MVEEVTDSANGDISGDSAEEFSSSDGGASFGPPVPQPPVSFGPPVPQPPVTEMEISSESQYQPEDAATAYALPESGRSLAVIRLL